MALRKFIIERNIPKVGSFEAKQLSDAAAKSNEALCQSGARPGSEPLYTRRPFLGALSSSKNVG